jgi:hypothetical protein
MRACHSAHDVVLYSKTRDFSLMDNPVPPLVAEKTSWRTIGPWIPSLLIPIVLALVLAAYVVILAAS